MMNRRQFLGTMGASALAVLLMRLPFSISKSRAQGRRIIIVGAGASGLMAGRILHDAGADVTLIEARDRLGGRVWTDKTLASHPVELGAEYIHGDSVITWDVLQALNLEGTLPAFDDDEHLAFYADGRWWRYPDWLSMDGLHLMDDIEEELTWVDPDESIASWLGVPVPTVINHLMASDNGADLDDLGVQGYIETTYAGSGEGDFRLRAGYDTLIHALAEGLDIRLNEPVQRITYDDAGVTVSTAQNSLEADAVIVTLPLGVLKAGDVVFEPDLPQSKRNAIQGLGAGKVNKLILRFDAPFWDADMEAFGTELDSQLWWRPDWGHAGTSPILTALIGGRAGERFSAMSEAEAIAEGVRQLGMMFERPDLHDHLVEGRFINWGADAYSKMGYSYVPVGGAGLRRVLAQPVGNRLYFAGEATEIAHPATVHGALMSAGRVAEQLLQAFA